MVKKSLNIRAKYDQIAPSYDFWDIIPERFFYRSWRHKLWGKTTSGHILEVGVGTGKNIAYYPTGASVTAIDVSSKMLAKAAQRAAGRPDVATELLPIDIAKLPFGEATFDAVVGSFILMVLPDPCQALEEMKRVCKPGGKLLFLEFTRSKRRAVAFLQDLLTPLTLQIYCAHLNRDIGAVIQSCGLKITNTEEVGGSLVKIIEAVSH